MLFLPFLSHLQDEFLFETRVALFGISRDFSGNTFGVGGDGRAFVFDGKNGHPIRAMRHLGGFYPLRNNFFAVQQGETVGVYMLTGRVMGMNPHFESVFSSNRSKIISCDADHNLVVQVADSVQRFFVSTGQFRHLTVGQVKGELLASSVDGDVVVSRLGSVLLNGQPIALRDSDIRACRILDKATVGLVHREGVRLLELKSRRIVGVARLRDVLDVVPDRGGNLYVAAADVVYLMRRDGKILGQSRAFGTSVTGMVSSPRGLLVCTRGGAAYRIRP